MGVDLKELLGVHIDTYAVVSAEFGFMNRYGVGRNRHIHTPSLWLQRAVHEGKVKLNEVDGK
eukprot:8114956-Heterocapsa_arctica.AAC.1